ncbi:hypothetical protein GCM10018785_45970 [Streptomyces longispororuber]|uniref:Uncharacterized protein n=1 Tax=Streptomyces longispororuber TaxID=68230 RepID=A0A919DS88_9ACTN|nr:hypothetical protein GCM10018785_45970 [Streptomyces longispororuber]
MAYAQLNAVLPSPSHPMAKTGYGKRHASDEPPHTEADFAHLPQRDAEIAAFIDHLPVGAAMGHKVIAAEHPRYGQQAVRTSMGRLTGAGHLRWVKDRSPSRRAVRPARPSRGCARRTGGSRCPSGTAARWSRWPRSGWRAARPRPTSPRP